MHPRPSAFARLRTTGSAAALLTLATSAWAQTTYYKANNTTTLTSAASWWSDELGTTAATTAPANTTSPTAICIWNSLVPAAQSLTIPDVGIQTLRILNPGGTITLDGNVASPRTVTVGNNGGIDMAQATQDLSLQNLFYRVAASGNTVNLQVASGRTLTFGSNAPVTVRNNSSGVTINVNTDGASSGTVKFIGNYGPSFLVVGGGRVELSRAAGNTRLATTQGTTLNGGTLVVANTSGSATGTGAVTVNNSATLAGSGTISGAVTAASGSTLSPGDNAVGTITLGSLTLAQGSTLIWEANNSVDADRIAVTANDGLVINGGTIKLYQPGTTTPFAGTGVFTLFTQTGAIGGTGLSALTIDESTKIAGRNYTLSQGAGVVTLAITDGNIVSRDWAVDASGLWSVASNWTGGVAPDGASTIARISGVGGAVLTAPRTVTLDSARTINGLILDAVQSASVDGSATLTLDGGGAAAALSSSGADHLVSAPIALSAGGALATVESASNTLTISAPVAGAGFGLVKAGNGTLLLTADNTYTGSTAITAGTLQIGSGGAAGSVAGAVSVSSSGILRVNRSGSVSFASPISGTGAVEFAGTGNTTLSVANTFSGNTTLSAGTLVLAHPQALQSSTLNYTVGGGSLVVADTVTSLTLGGLAGNRAIPLANTALAPLSLTVGGNNASTSYSGSPAGSGVNFTKAGTGTLALSGNHAYTGNTTVSAGVLSLDTGAVFTTSAADLGTGSTATLRVNGGTLNAATGYITNASVGLAVAGGVANFSGAILSESGSSSAESFINVTGGTLNAGSISLSRGSLSITTEPATGQTGQGLYVNGGAVNVTGALGIGAGTTGFTSGANSSVSGRMDSGSITVGGALTVSINNTGRWSVFDVNGGNLTVNDTVGGILLGGTTAGQVIMHVRGSALVNAPRIQFGQGALAGKSILSLSGGELYVGSGGLALGSTDATFAPELRLLGGKLGATGNWSSPIPVKINGNSPVIVTGASPANVPYSVTFTGNTTGLGALTKNGAGSVFFTSSANDYYGPTVVSAGTLGLAGRTSDVVTVQTDGTLAPQGVLTADTGLALDGALALRYDSAAATPVDRVESPGGAITLGATSRLVVTGTGNLPGPAYVILKSGTAVNGTFGTTSLPAGLTVDYAYDDDSNPATPAVVALVGGISASPYDAWTSANQLSGANALASADPDQDGFANLLEFAFATSPTSPNAAPWTIARSGNVLTLSFPYPANSGLAYSIEATSDLAGIWTTVQTYPAFTTAGTATYTDTADLTANPRRFLRLKITPAP